MGKKDVVTVDTKDLYQLLIAECRYGYGRNNHLMPDGAYNHVHQYLPLMKEADPAAAFNTAVQLAEECISEEIEGHYYNGLDDEFDNRAAAIEFVESMVDFAKGCNVTGRSPYPYNYRRYEENKKKDDDPIYDVYEVCDDGSIKKLNQEPLSHNQLATFVFKQVGPEDKTSVATYTRPLADYHNRVFQYEFNEPEHKIIMVVHEKIAADYMREHYN